MFQHLDASLAALLRRELRMPNVTISFDPPDKTFNAPPPALSLFLYDIRENPELPGNRWELDPLPPEPEKPPSHRVRRRTPARIDCAYMITAWTGTSVDAVREEHRLLGATLTALLAHREFPADDLVEELRTQSSPIPVRVSAGTQMQNIGDFWQSMGGRPKAALHALFTLSIDPSVARESEPTVTQSQVVVEGVEQ